ncbi:MAG: zinc-binding dehydrogenase [Actinobacteria bacterium]|nr:zinc-binding dehydrogenase [Actinomycetota bacterium]
MKAIHITAFGGPEVMNLVELADPVPGADEVLLEVTAIGINYADTHQTENSYLSPQTLPMIPGLEITGTFEGKRYLASASSGGYAQKATVNKAALIAIPDGVTDQQALCMLVQGSTAWHLLRTMGHIEKGQSVVVHAAAGGVGTIAIQLAKLWGAKVIAVTSSEEKSKLAKSLGADAVVDAKSTELSKAIREANGGKCVDLILEMVGGTTFDQSLLALTSFGKLITFGMASRTAPTPIHPGALMHGSKTVSGFWLSNCFGKKEMMNDVIDELFKLVIDGKLKPIIGATYPLSEAASAHRSMLARGTVGKIALDPAL